MGVVLRAWDAYQRRMGRALFVVAWLVACGGRDDALEEVHAQVEADLRAAVDAELGEAAVGAILERYDVDSSALLTARRSTSGVKGLTTIGRPRGSRPSPSNERGVNPETKRTGRFGRI